MCKGTGRLVKSGSCLGPRDRANETASAATDCMEEPKSQEILVRSDLSSGKVQANHSILHQSGTTSKKAPSARDITFSMTCDTAPLKAESHLTSSRNRLLIFNTTEEN